jgi:outer membrane lipoprotein-sorting protein
MHSLGTMDGLLNNSKLSLNLISKGKKMTISSCEERPDLTSPPFASSFRVPIGVACVAIMLLVQGEANITQCVAKDTKDTNAQDILQSVEKTYLDCNSYRDTGTVKIVSAKSGRVVIEKSFNTAFVRPDRLRFELMSVNLRRSSTYIVWRNAKQFRFTPEIPGVEKPDTINLAMSAIAGASSWTAHGVPGLLLPKEIEGPRITELKEPKRIENANLGDRECFRIKGTGNILEQPMTLWIDKKTFLIRRIDMTTNVKNTWTESTTTYNPEINMKIPEEMLEFTRKER